MKGKLFTRRRMLRLAVYGGGAATLGHTALVEPFWLELVERNLPVRDLPAGLKGKTLVQISDIHCGGLVSENYLIESFKRVAALRPDIVVYTGDFVSVDAETEGSMARVFPHLPKGEIGTVASLGNHDYGVSFLEEEWAQKIIRALGERGIPVLRNETLDISGLQIMGLDDSWAERIDLEKGLASLDPGRASLVLSHNPDTVDQGDWQSYQGWILSGHTHGGQCKPPFLAPPVLPVANKLYTAGHFSLKGGRDLYINRALGYLHQVRFNVRPEVTVFELV
ncbi:metallophosphoesterase [Akkermansiaceae bacterium]|nr:metallophosphoesterase [Akkermansiaceae bacterium]